ncbi:8-oxo-dGTP diphosphatase [Lachnospiraceae bacterium C7]|nr:8-oxo-dGTP diphosphatase [Lachnospiraceae bacterium C7]
MEEKKTQKNQQSEQEFLKAYDSSKYEKPSVTADILVFTVVDDELGLLLIRRKNHPYKDCWAIPGGFVSMDETAEQAAKRELFEETHIQNVCLEQLYTFSGVHRDPRMRVISISYIAMVPFEKMKFKSGDDAKDVRLFMIKEDGRDIQFIDKENPSYTISSKELAFDHYEIVRMAIDRMRGKLAYSNIGFAFLNDIDKFTLTDIRKIYDAISGEKADVGNFRRFIKREYEETGKINKIAVEKLNRGRPATIYRWNQERGKINEQDFS